MRLALGLLRVEGRMRHATARRTRVDREPGEGSEVWIGCSQMRECWEVGSSLICEACICVARLALQSESRVRRLVPRQACVCES
jgi:hypothetical protein